MALQEYGGTKEPTSAKTVAVPKAARPTPQSTTPRSKWPGKVSRKFTITKGDTTYLYSRTGRRTGRHVPHARKGQGQKRGPGFRDPKLKLMYVMKRSVQVKPRLGMLQTVQRVANARLPINFDGFLRYAIRTAK